MQDFEKDILHFPFYLYRCALGFRNQLNKALIKEFGEEMTVDFWLILSLLYEQDNLPHNQLSERVSRDKASLSRSLDTMEKLGLVRKVTDPNDRRSSRICLTGKSVALREELSNFTLNQTQQMLKGLNPIEVKELIRMLNQVFNLIKE